MSARRGTINGEEALIDLDGMRFIPVEAGRQIVETIDGACFIRRRDEEDKMRWIPILVSDIVSISPSWRDKDIIISGL